jgi:hypothetical protein
VARPSFKGLARAGLLLSCFAVWPVNHQALGDTAAVFLRVFCTLVCAHNFTARECKKHVSETEALCHRSIASSRGVHTAVKASVACAPDRLIRVGGSRSVHHRFFHRNIRSELHALASRMHTECGNQRRTMCSRQMRSQECARSDDCHPLLASPLSWPRSPSPSLPLSFCVLDGGFARTTSSNSADRCQSCFSVLFTRFIALPRASN